MQIRHTSFAALLAVASAIAASTIAAAPPATAAQCVSSRGPNPVTLCSQGDTRVSNKTPLTSSTPYVPYPCTLDWSCDDGFSIALAD
jgi:hypothetical protein